MAKVKKDSSSPKKRDRSSSKKINVEPSTSKTEKRSTTKKSTSKKSAPTVTKVNINIDRPEKSRRTSKDHSKISEKSKTAISKSRTTKKKLKDINWLKGLLKQGTPSKQSTFRTDSGIVARFPPSLKLRIEDKIEYVTYPWHNGKCGGYVKIGPGLEKKPKKTIFTMNFIILLGKIHLLSGERSTEYKSGTVITVPRGVKYGLKNRSKTETCYMRFQTICD